MAKFNHLHVPDQWHNYFSKYPQGLSLLEALMNWITQVDNMVDNQNELNNRVDNFRTELDKFIERFEPNLQKEVSKTLDDWLSSGFLDAIIKPVINKVRSNQTACISFIFDDGYQEDELTYSIFKEYGLTCGFALIRNRLYNSSANSVENYRKYQDEGFSILSHSNTHLDLTDVSEGVAYEEIVESQRVLRNYGLRATGFIAPYNRINEGQQLPIIKSHYDYAFTGSGSVLPGDNVGHVGKSADIYTIARISLLKNSLEDIKEAIDNCILERGFINFFEHRTGVEGHVSEEKLRSVLDYITSYLNTGNVLVLSPDDAVNYYFGKQLKPIKERTTNLNYAPPLEQIGTNSTAKENGWQIHQHSEAVEEYNHNDGILSIVYPSGATNGKQTTLQHQFNLVDRNMRDEANRNIVVGFNLWSERLIPDGVDITLEARFYDKDGNTDRKNHVLVLPVSHSKQRITTIFTPYDAINYEHVQVFLRIRFTKSIPSQIDLYVEEPFIGIGLQEERGNETQMGINNSGRWIKHGDGTLEVFRTVELDLSVSTTQEFDMPQTFKSGTDVFVSGNVMGNPGDPRTGDALALSNSYISAGSSRTWVFRCDASGETTDRPFNLYATGKWR